MCYKGPAGWPESLARALPIIQGRGNVNNSLHCFFWFWIVPSAKGSFSDLLSHFPTLSYLPPEKRGRGTLTLNIQIDFTLGLAQSFINRGGYLMPPWIQKSWGIFCLFVCILPKFCYSVRLKDIKYHLHLLALGSLIETQLYFLYLLTAICYQCEKVEKELWLWLWVIKADISCYKMTLLIITELFWNMVFKFVSYPWKKRRTQCYSPYIQQDNLESIIDYISLLCKGLICC